MAAGVDPDESTGQQQQTEDFCLRNVRYWEHFADRARELLTLLDWAKANGELEHQHFLNGAPPHVNHMGGPHWNTGDSDE